MVKLSQKTIDCLLIADKTDSTWSEKYNIACDKYSEKAVYRKMEKLAGRGYIEYGVSARTGWLTEKGREVLAAII